MPHVSLEKRIRIHTLLEEGHSTRSIALRESVARSTVFYIQKLKNETGSFVNRPKSGRPRILNKRDERKIIRLISTHECSTAVDIQKNIRIYDNINVSTDTIRRVLRRNGLHARIRRKKPYLKKEHQKRQLAFARKYQNWTIEDWKHVIWSDESKFQIFGSDGCKYCWKRPGEQLKSYHVQPTVKFGGGSIMVWGCFTEHGVGNLCCIEGKLNGAGYRNILENNLIGTLNKFDLNIEDIVFQQDNDPKHTAKLTKNGLRITILQFLIGLLNLQI